MTLSRGIDVSHHQGSVSWSALKAECGLTWGACKATEGTSFLDNQFGRNWAGLRAAGLTRVAYHFARPESSTADRQVDYFLSVVKPVAGDVLCLDLEASKLTQAGTNAWAKRFGDLLRQRAPQCTTVAYLGGYAGNESGRNLSQHFDLWWFPRYRTMSPVTASSWPATFAPRIPSNKTGWTAPHIWQWAASLQTRVGQVDANVSTLTAAQIAGVHQPTTRPDVTPAPTPTPPPEAQEAPMIVIRKEKGWWYLLLGSKLIGLYAGQNIDPRLPRITVDEKQWARLLKAKIEVIY